MQYSSLWKSKQTTTVKQKWKGRQILAAIQIIPKMLCVCAGSIPTHWQLNDFGEGGGSSLLQEKKIRLQNGNRKCRNAYSHVVGVNELVLGAP